MHRFYAPDIAETLQLPGQASQPAVRVLRMSEGDELEVVDGCGCRYACRITLAHSKRCAIEIVERVEEKPRWGCEIVLAVAPTKNLDRMEWLAEKVTEMGIDRIIPLRCRYSERKELKTARLQKILVSAMKQSLKATLPQLDEMTPVIDVIRAPFEGKRYIAYCDPSIPRRIFAQQLVPDADVMIMVGPEGDFSPEEIEAALAAGFEPISLGDSRLRTETAAMFAVATVHALRQQKS